MNYFNISGTAGNAANVNDTPTTAWWHIARFNHSNSAGYYTDLAIPFNSNSLYWKTIRSGVVANGGWIKVLDALNYTEYTVSKTGSGASGTWGISVSGNAGTATKLATSRTIAISGGATGTATAFDGTANIAIPITSLDATKLTGTATISTTGNAATATKATQDGSGNVITTRYAPLVSPTFTGTPKAPTATAGTNTTQIATTAFVTSAVSSARGNVTYLSATAPTSPKTGDTWYQIL